MADTTTPESETPQDTPNADTEVIVVNLTGPSEGETQQRALEEQLHLGLASTSTTVPDNARFFNPFCTLSWCQQSAAHCFQSNGPSDQQPTLTSWGLKVFRVLLNGILERNVLLSPALMEWLRENVLPCLLPSDDHNSLTYLLVQCLFKCLEGRPQPMSIEASATNDALIMEEVSTIDDASTTAEPVANTANKSRAAPRGGAKRQSSTTTTASVSKRARSNAATAPKTR